MTLKKLCFTVLFAYLIIFISPSYSTEKNSGKEKYLLVTCMDYRFQNKINDYMNEKGLGEQYDQFILPGASLGVTQHHYIEWRKTFFTVLQIAEKLHQIKTVIIIDHDDCGMYQKVYGEKAYQDHAKELHQKNLVQLKEMIHNRYPKMKIETFVMNKNGEVK